MTAEIRRHPTLVVVIALVIAMSCIGMVLAMAQSETPRRGGILLARPFDPLLATPGLAAERGWPSARRR